MEPQYVQAQGRSLSAKVSFFSIDQVDMKLPGYNQRVLNSVFKVTRIIYIVRSSKTKIPLIIVFLVQWFLRQGHKYILASIRSHDAS